MAKQKLSYPHPALVAWQLLRLLNGSRVMMMQRRRVLMMLLVADQYVGRRRGNMGRGVVGGELPVRGMGRQEVEQVGG